MKFDNSNAGKDKMKNDHPSFTGLHFFTTCKYHLGIKAVLPKSPNADSCIRLLPFTDNAKVSFFGKYERCQ